MNKLMLTRSLLQNEPKYQPSSGKRITKKVRGRKKLRVGSQLKRVDDGPIWDIMGKLLFAGESRISYRAEIMEKIERVQEPLGDSRLDADHDGLIWDIMARLVFPEPVPLT